jgi:hypothetical protein
MYVYFALSSSMVTEIFEIDTEITNRGLLFLWLGIYNLQYLYIYTNVTIANI